MVQAPIIGAEEALLALHTVRGTATPSIPTALRHLAFVMLETRVSKVAKRSKFWKKNDYTSGEGMDRE